MRRQHLYGSLKVARKEARRKRQQVYRLPDGSYYVGTYDGALRSTRRHMRQTRPRLTYSPRRPRRRRKKGLLEQLIGQFT